MKIWKLKWVILGLLLNYNFQDKKEKQFVGHQIILLPKYYNLKGMGVKWIFGVLELLLILWLMEDLLSNLKMSNRPTKKLN